MAQDFRCRAMWNTIRQSGPESGPSFQVKQLKNFKVLPFRSVVDLAHVVGVSSCCMVDERFGPGVGFRVQGLGFRVWGLGVGVQELGFRVWGLGFEVWDSGFGF